jgi:CrcB protein
MMNYLLVAVGGALGSMARFWCSGFVARQFGEWFPWGTLIVNVLGSFVIGAFAALSATEGPFLIRPELRVFVMVGLCGGYPKAYRLRDRARLCRQGLPRS